jgi:tetratricopeptide (TPR) repeat protein
MHRLVRPLLLGALLGAFPGTGGNLAARPADSSAGAQSAPEDPARQAREQAEAGSRAFAAGDFLRAAESFGRAVGLDPSQAGYGVLRARALGELVSPNDRSAANVARLRTVVEIYEELLAADPANEEYAQTVASLYSKVGDEAGRDAWLLGRARNRALPAKVRANALRASADTALAAASREDERGRRDAAAALAARARERLDEAVALSPDALACHALLLHGLELEVAIARTRRDAARQVTLQALLSRARRSADAAMGRARLTAATPGDY